MVMILFIAGTSHPLYITHTVNIVDMKAENQSGLTQNEMW